MKLLVLIVCTIILAARTVSAQLPVDASATAKMVQRSSEEETLRWHLRALSGDHPHEYQPAMRWLCEHQDISRLALREHLVVNQSEWYAFRGVKALACMAHPDDVDFLGELLLDESLSFEAGQALAANPAPASLTYLLAGALDERKSVAHASLVALAAKGDEQGRAVFEQQLQNPVQQLRYDAARGLEHLGAAPSMDALMKAKAIEKDADIVPILARTTKQ